MLRRNFFVPFLSFFGLLTITPALKENYTTNIEPKINVFTRKNKKRIEIEFVHYNKEEKIMGIYAIHHDLPLDSSQEIIIKKINYLFTQVQVWTTKSI